MGIRWTGEVPRQACPAAVVYLTKHFKLDSPLQEVCIMGKISPQCLWGTDDSPPTYYHWLATGRNLHTQCCTHSQVKDLEKLTRSCISSDSGHSSEQSQPGSNLVYPQEPLDRCLFDQAYLAWLNPLLGEWQVICCHPQWMAMAGNFCRTDDSLLDHQAAIALLLPLCTQPTCHWILTCCYPRFDLVEVYFIARWASTSSCLPLQLSKRPSKYSLIHFYKRCVS